MYYSQITKNRIKELCRNKKLNMELMLSECSLGVNAIRQINDTKGMSSFSLAKIADYLDCSVDYLLGRTDNVHSHKTIEILKNTEKKESILNMDYITDKELNNARKVMEVWLKDTTITVDEIINFLKIKTNNECTSGYHTLNAWICKESNYFDNKISILAELTGYSLDFLLGVNNHSSAKAKNDMSSIAKLLGDYELEIPVYTAASDGKPPKAKPLTEEQQRKIIKILNGDN